MSDLSSKRLFFAFDVKAPWPETLPLGRIIEERYRHLTVAFLGRIEAKPLLSCLHTLPLPQHKVGIVGKFDQPLFLPPRRAHVVAWNISWLQDPKPLIDFQHLLLDQLEKNGFPADRRHDFLPHVSIARSPFNIKAWRKSFREVPAFITSLHLFESLGSSKYNSLWEFPIIPPFEEIEHTADIGYTVYGERLDEIFIHAASALAFSYKELVDFLTPPSKQFRSLEEVIAELNKIVALTDQKIGCPFKAVSYHGKVKETENGILSWEMIIDV